MNIESLRAYCLAKAGVTEGFPFDESTLVFKVMGKMFLLLSLDGDDTANMKNTPEACVALREELPEAVLPGYHMDKKHWNTVRFTRLPDSRVQAMVDISYDLVVAKLKKSEREALQP